MKCGYIVNCTGTVSLALMQNLSSVETTHGDIKFEYFVNSTGMVSLALIQSLKCRNYSWGYQV